MPENVQRFFIPGQMPGLNEIINEAKRMGWRAGRKGSRWSGYARMKRRWTNEVVLAVRKAKLKPVRKAFLTFIWHEPNRKRDPDNVAAGGRKFILDGLVRAGILPDDTKAHVVGWEDRFLYCNGSGVEIIIQGK